MIGKVSSGDQDENDLLRKKGAASRTGPSISPVQGACGLAPSRVQP